MEKLRPVYFTLFFILIRIQGEAYSATNPCGVDNFMNLVDRPNNADSPCTIPFKHIEFELGYAYQKLTQGEGYGQNFPQAEVRLGLPWRSELFVTLPNYTRQSKPALAGFNNATLGLKHQLFYDEQWIISVDGGLNLPGGSQAFSIRQSGSYINMIVSDNLTDKLGLTLMLGGSSIAPSLNEESQRYSSFNSFVVLSYAPVTKVSIYAEVYGQTKTAWQQGSGFSIDAGVLYLQQANLIFDISAGQRLYGYLGGVENYIQAGLSFLI